MSKDKARHDIRDEELAGFDFVPIVAVDQQLDAGILVLPDQIDGLDTVPTKSRNGLRAANRSRFAATAASSRARQPSVAMGLFDGAAIALRCVDKAVILRSLRLGLSRLEGRGWIRSIEPGRVVNAELHG